MISVVIVSLKVRHRKLMKVDEIKVTLAEMKIVGRKRMCLRQLMKTEDTRSEGIILVDQ